MEQTIIKAVEKKYGVSPLKIEALGGGFYGRAFAVTICKEPYLLVAKLYLFEGVAVKEAEQLTVLKMNALLKMPDVFCIFEKEYCGSSYDVLLMEYIDGKNAGWLDVCELPEKSRINICENIVDNLIAYHNAVNPKGFGAVSCERFCNTWQEYYYPIAKSIVNKAKHLHAVGQLNDFILSVFESSIERFNEIFYIPVTEARLIHGDYNAWNIMLSEQCDKAIAVIDPYNCCFGDSEYDLYQLDNANGKEYGLLKRYAEKVTLSENFEAKRRFYELYSEVSHYHDAKVNVDIPSVEGLAKKLNEVL